MKRGRSGGKAPFIKAKAPVKQVPCVHWNECDGCPLIRFDYNEQLKMKREKVVKAFVKQGFSEKDTEKLVKPTRRAPLTLGYRNKAKWILQLAPDGDLKMGIYKRGSHDVEDIPHCAVHAPEINELSAAIKDLLMKHKVPCGTLDASTAKTPLLRYMIVRYSFREKKLIVVFVTSTKQVPGLDKVVAGIEKDFEGRVVAIVQNINSDSGNVLLGEANRYLVKKGELSETMGSFRVPVGPLSFLQVNSKQAAYLYKRVQEILGQGPFLTGLDLYSGVGLFAMHMASRTHQILAVEEVGPAALEGITACRRNNVQNVMQFAGDALEGLQSYLGEFGAPHWVVVNPPRKGCEEKVLQTLVTRPPKKLIYISCNPLSLARDLQTLMRLCPDFQLKLVEPVDMFPQTDHVETIAVLENPRFKRTSRAPVGGSQIPDLEPDSKEIH